MIKKKRWAMQQTTDPQLQAALKQLSTTDIKIIAYLGRRGASRAKSLPAPTELSQATISRGLTKLSRLKLATKYRDLTNNKEILVRLTTLAKQSLIYTRNWTRPLLLKHKPLLMTILTRN
ncbi:hypothetical protein S101258_02796 [Lactiplantibacillus plantarum subsp. plantarum]|uniref:Uncharacterized protein n=1 Tax=Lactiplantibacillus plantarum subsp. plantarum TaxID=337330 RepID=A0A2S3U2J6_LACPN|nr:hypothetical protein S101258_02796 [Lactiplantibacillus plantarum subsp. plantarum]